jgi:integrase
MVRTAKPSPFKPRKERTSIDRLQRYVGVRVVSWYYLYPDGRSETLAKAPRGDREAMALAEKKAMRHALDIQQGQVLAGSVAQMIERFEEEVAPTHYADQSKAGVANRKAAFRNLTKFFGKMAPQQLKTIHGYQYLDDRAKSGAPSAANKEMAYMSTICKYAIRWGTIESNPFQDMMLNTVDSEVRTITRSQCVRFYLWAIRQDLPYLVMGCAAMFAYLTGFRAAEVRPFHASGLKSDAVYVVSAKRKKGENQVMKARVWSTRLKVVVKRAQQARKHTSLYLFANRRNQPYTKSGWNSVWQDAMLAWIATFDPVVAQALKDNPTGRHQKGSKSLPYPIATHPMYFALSDVRPSAITAKLDRQEADAYDFAAHANPATTHKHYDRRKVRRASATE